MSTLDLQKCLSFMSSLMQQTDIHPSCLAQLIQSFNFEWLESSDSNSRRVALACLSAMVSILVKKSGQTTRAEIKSGRAASNLKGPFEVRDSILHIGFDGGIVDTNNNEANALLKLSCVPTPTESYVYSYGLKRNGIGQTSLLLTLTTQRLVELLSNPRLVTCLPDPINSVIFVQLVLPGKPLNPSIGFKKESQEEWAARRKPEPARLTSDYQRSIFNNLIHKLEQAFNSQSPAAVTVRPLRIGALIDDVVSDSDAGSYPQARTMKAVASQYDRRCSLFDNNTKCGERPGFYKIKAKDSISVKVIRDSSINDVPRFKRINEKPVVSLTDISKIRSKTMDIRRGLSEVASFHNLQIQDSEFKIGKGTLISFRIGEIRGQNIKTPKRYGSVDINKASRRNIQQKQLFTFTDLPKVNEFNSRTKIPFLNNFKPPIINSSETMTSNSKELVGAEPLKGSRNMGFFKVRSKKC